MQNINSQESQDKLLNCQEVAKLLNVKLSRIRTAVFKREIPFVKVGRLVRFRQTDLKTWLSRHLVNARDMR